jgi:hypothetical protein
MMNLSGPFEIFIPKEEEPEENSGGQKELRKLLIPFLEGCNGKSHGQTAGDKKEGVECPKRSIQFSCSQVKIYGILKSVDRIENKKPPEEKNLRKEKEPHAYLRAGIVLVGLCNHLPTRLILQIRSTKSEIRNNSKIANSNVPNLVCILVI